MECGICFHRYTDIGNRRPRSLSCGHTFCTACISSIFQKNTLVCPTCRTIHAVDSVDQIAVNYSLLEILALMGDNPEDEDKATTDGDGVEPTQKSIITVVPNDFCSEHEELWQYRCVPCDTWMCSKCLVVDHLDKGCRVISSRQALEEMLEQQRNMALCSSKYYDDKLLKLRNFESSLEVHIQKHESQIKGLLDLTEKQYSIVRMLKEERHRVHEVLEEGKLCRISFQDAFVRSGQVSSQRDVSSTLRELRKNDFLVNQWTKTAWEKFTTANIREASLKHLLLGTAALRLLGPTAEDENCPDVNPLDSEGDLYAVHEEVDGRVKAARVTMTGGHALMYAFEDGAPPEAAMKIQYSSILQLISRTPVCFLSLSHGDIYIGKVYIRAFSPSCRSHQFRLLCTGELGPSYKGASFFSLQKAGEPGECLLGGDYDKGNGSGGAPLMKGIKPGPEYRELVTAGLVAGSNGEHSSLFGIFLRGWNGVSDTAFGKVVKNLKVVQNVVSHVREIHHLKISDCGIVIPI